MADFMSELRKAAELSKVANPFTFHLLRDATEDEITEIGEEISARFKDQLRDAGYDGIVLCRWDGPTPEIKQFDQDRWMILWSDLKKLQGIA